MNFKKLGTIIITVILIVVPVTILVLVFYNNETPPINPTTSAPVPTTTEDPDTAVLYEVGVDIADITGPCVDIGFMGYGDAGQKGQGLHTRQYARTFIFVKGDQRIVLVTADVYAVGIAVKREVVRMLQLVFDDIYTLRNVIMTGTHTHSAPGGHMVDFLQDISILGFSSETYNAYVTGIFISIILAHFSISPARLYFGQTSVKNVHMNRSPYSYGYNPAEERARYDTDTDDTLSQVRIVSAFNGNLVGVLNWFSVHTTSMNMTNRLISSDNLGYAALRMEKTLNPNRPTGQPNIVAGFFASSLGDVSPNIHGARCEFSGEECDNQFLLCDAGERCYSLGPGDDMFESTKIVGTAVYEGAMEVLNMPGEELRGEIAVIHQFVEMSEETVARYDPVERTFNTSEPVSGCVPAVGYNFASGTIDGANILNITQGTITGNPLLDSIGGIVVEPTEADVECHAPKPILLATGRADFPFPWHPRVVSVSLIWLADFVIAGVPGEPTTMAGRRIKDVVGRVMESHGFQPRVAVSGITNEYIHYVTTFEEYQIQRYEAASTIYGPHTLDIFLNKFSEFTTVAIEGGDVDPGPEPEDNYNKTISMIPPVLFDSPPFGSSFGDVLEQPPATVRRGETVSATFVGANPRNDMRRGFSSHATIERLELGQWNVLANDADWETKFFWEQQSTVTGTSRARFEWAVPSDAILSAHRIVYNGASLAMSGNITQFSGYSDSFEVTN